MPSAGIDQSAVIAAAGRYLGIEEKELARPTKRYKENSNSHKNNVETMSR